MTLLQLTLKICVRLALSENDEAPTGLGPLALLKIKDPFYSVVTVA